jgi:DNA-binding NarL/FixJ family response regulator
MIETESHVRESLQAGANGYVAKDATADDLCAAAAALAAGRTQIVSIPQARTVRDEPAGSLTPRLTARELEVLRSLASADGNQAIAKRLGISDKTLRNHIRSIYGKLGIYDRAQAVLVGVRSGLIPVSSPS